MYRYLLLASCALTYAAAQTTITLTPPASVPSGASAALNPSFAGFGIEPSHLYAYTGGENTNQFSINLLQNLADYTGKPPHLRIGGNAGDYIIYQSSYTGCDVETNPNSGPYRPDEFVVGSCYFGVMNRFPKGTPITYGLNMALDGEGYLDVMVETAAAARDTLIQASLVGFEIGNEPDLYLLNGFRKGEWDGSVYTQQWLQRANAVWSGVLEGNIGTSQFFEPACTASTTGQTSNGTGATFSITDLVTDGISASANGTSKSLISGFNQHDYFYYIGVSTTSISLAYATDLYSTTAQFTAWAAQAAQASAAGYPYYLREMGMVGPIGLAGVTDTFAASLWTLNFFLYAATLGIAQVNFHMTKDSNASAWQPIPWPPYSPAQAVRPSYYAFAAMAQIVGKECSTQIAPLAITHTDGQPAAYDNRIVGYTSFKAGKLAAVILINTQIANVSESSKPGLSFSLHLPHLAGQTLYLSYLTAAGADATSGTSWNGSSFERSGDGTASVEDHTVHSAIVSSDGVATLSIRDSQAVVANVGAFVGSGGVDEAACAKFANVTPKRKATASGSATAMAGTATGTAGQSGATSSDRPRVSTLPSTSAGALTPQANIARTGGVALWWSAVLAMGVVGLCL